MRRVFGLCQWTLVLLMVAQFYSCKESQSIDPVVLEPVPDTIATVVEEVVDQCIYDSLDGLYIFYDHRDTSNVKVDIFLDTMWGEQAVNTSGIAGYRFWYPSAPLSGCIDSCMIKLHSYNNVKREGLPSPGGYKRYYYESMNGYGEYFAENDSIVLFINYTRTGDFPLEYSGTIHFKKIE